MPAAYDAYLETLVSRFEAIDHDMAAKVRDPLRCPVELLGHLAWSRGLDYWGDWATSVKRQLILQTPANLRIRGTREAINEALSAFAADVTILEWWEQDPEGTPGTAEVTVALGADLGQNPDDQDLVVQLLARESRKSIHTTLILGVGGNDAIAAESRARVAALYQHSGVQAGAA